MRAALRGGWGAAPTLKFFPAAPGGVGRPDARAAVQVDEPARCPWKPNTRCLCCLVHSLFRQWCEGPGSACSQRHTAPHSHPPCSGGLRCTDGSRERTEAGMLPAGSRSIAGGPLGPGADLQAPSWGPPQAWCWFAGPQLGDPSGLVMVCRPPVGNRLGSRDRLQAPSSGLSSASLCFHLWLSADFPCTPRLPGVVCPDPGPVPCTDPHPLCDPPATPPGKKPGAVPAPHQLCPLTDLGPIEVQLPRWTLPLPHLWGRRCASF